MMRGHEIIESISWSGDVHPETVKQIQAAIEALDRKAYGTNRPAYNAMEVHRRMTDLITKHGGQRGAAEAVGKSKSFFHDMYAGNRPVPDDVLASLGLMRTRKEFFVPID